MRNLSVMEQKQVNGGIWLVKVYRYSDGQLDSYMTRAFESEDDAWDWCLTINNSSCYWDDYHALEPQER